MYRAIRWRKRLMGSSDDIHRLRKCNIGITKVSSYSNDIEKDLQRTFPSDMFFTEHISTLSDILNTYAHVNKGMGYAQGMAFMVFVLYKVYYNDDQKNAMYDTYFSFHTLVHFIRPCYPLDADDGDTMTFLSNVEKSILLILAIEYPRIVENVKGTCILQLCLLRNIPSLFGVSFEFEEIIVIWDFLLHKSSNYSVFHRIVCIVAAIVISMKEIIISMDVDATLSLMHSGYIYKLSYILYLATTLAKESLFLDM